MLEITAPIDRDFDYFHDNLCIEDRDELEYVSGITSERIGSVIKGYVAQSFIAHTVVDNKTGLPVAIFGCIAKESEDQQKLVGYPWMLSTGELWKYSKEALGLAKQSIEALSNFFSYMHVIASEKHPKSIPFLKAIGFKEDVTINIPDLKGKCLIYV